MMVIIGAAGFIGQHLVRQLLQTTSETVVGLDNLYRGSWEGLRAYEATGRLTLVEADVRDRSAMQAALQGAHTVFHLAAQSNVIGAITDLDYSFDVNVTGTYNVLRAARANGVKRVVFTSSREVYGEARELPVRETAPIGAKNAYGASKVAGETYCQVFDAPEMRVMVVRLTNVYGAGDRDRVIPIFMNCLRHHQPLVIYGDNKILDFVPVETVVEALWRVAQRQPAEPINIGSGRGTRLQDLAAQMMALSGQTVPIEIVPLRAVEVTQFVAATERMKTWLDMEPPADPLAALPAMFKDWRV